MLGGAMITTIETLWKRYKNKTKIAEMTGHDWKTIDKVVKLFQSGGEYPSRKPHPKILDPYKEKIMEWIEKEDLTGIRIFEKLREEGVKVGYSTVKNYVKEIKGKKEVFIRIETKPGEEAQVDFGYAGKTPDNNGKKRKTWVFNMRLSYSRLDYYEKVYDQRVETFIQCHINAFKYFGGVPKYVKIDNLKAAILEANFYSPVFQTLYKNFAAHYDFSPIPCRVRKPNDKGKVESGIKYVKKNFFLGRTFKDEKDLDCRLHRWLNNTCNQRIHGTIRKVPKELFEKEEKEKLTPLPPEDFNMSKVGTRKVYHDCHIYVEYNYYSVPFDYVGKEVEIDLSENLLRIFHQGTEIAVHPKQSGRGKFSTKTNHYPRYKMASDTEYQEKYQLKMSKIGPYCEQLFFLVVKEHPTDWSRTVQGILSLLKSYPKEILESSCKRALAYNACNYQIIKNICSNGSYNLPVEFNYVEQEVNHEYFKN